MPVKDRTLLIQWTPDRVDLWPMCQASVVPRLEPQSSSHCASITATALECIDGRYDADPHAWSNHLITPGQENCRGHEGRRDSPHGNLSLASPPSRYFIVEPARVRI